MAEMLNKFDLLSVNQTSAQIKVTEEWKASRDRDFPIKLRNAEGEKRGIQNERSDHQREEK